MLAVEQQGLGQAGQPSHAAGVGVAAVLAVHPFLFLSQMRCSHLRGLRKPTSSRWVASRVYRPLTKQVLAPWGFAYASQVQTQEQAISSQYCAEQVGIFVQLSGQAGRPCLEETHVRHAHREEMCHHRVKKFEHP